MADFPGAIASLRTVDNLPGITYDATKTKQLFAEDINLMAEEVMAIESTLGVNPEGAYPTVVDRLNAMGGVGGGGLATSWFFM